MACSYALTLKLVSLIFLAIFTQSKINHGFEILTKFPALRYYPAYLFAKSVWVCLGMQRDSNFYNMLVWEMWKTIFAVVKSLITH